MLQPNQRRYIISGTYPKNPILRQKHRGKTPPASDYRRVDLAMKEPIRVINEELGLTTFSCCECHPCDVDRRHYEVFRYKGRESDYTYRPPYRSYIALDLVRYHRVFDLIEYLKEHGFAEDKDAVPKGRFDVLKGDEKTDIARIRKNHTLKAFIPAGTLSLNYSYYGTGEPADTRCSIDVTPPQKKHIRHWSEWDNIRDKGWERWLQILYLFHNYH